MKLVPKTAIYLGLVSFFTDLSSEMIYPLLPIFLSSVLGAGVLALGMIAGIAEATGSLLKVTSGIRTMLVQWPVPWLRRDFLLLPLFLSATFSSFCYSGRGSNFHLG